MIPFSVTYTDFPLKRPPVKGDQKSASFFCCSPHALRLRWGHDTLLCVSAAVWIQDGTLMMQWAGRNFVFGDFLALLEEWLGETDSQLEGRSCQKAAAHLFWFK